MQRGKPRLCCDSRALNVWILVACLQEDGDKVRFFEGLFPKLSNLPSEVGVFKLLPVFRDYVRLEGASAQQVRSDSGKTLLAMWVPLQDPCRIKLN